MRFPRSSGVLLHPTSLPGPFGIGDLGPNAELFVDFLYASGQKLWQVLPLGPTGYGDSPYACYSAFAGNTLLISPERLISEGLLTESDVDSIESNSVRIDFAAVHSHKDKLLRRAFERFRTLADQGLHNAFKDFSHTQREWLDDYTLFRALKNSNDGKLWSEWPREQALWDRSALVKAQATLAEEIEAQKFYQFLFFQQWSALKRYCKLRGIKIIGDIPIFVALDSADVWTNPEQFKLDADRKPIVVAGVPPDYFSETGQYWGNPIYNWEGMLADGFKWWIKRVQAAFTMFDIVRVDHFRGFAASWEIPGTDKTAERGRWVNVPGKELFSAIRNQLGQLPIIAEDLGVITPDVEELRDALGFPGMKVLQFAFGGDSSSGDLPHNYKRNLVVYTGTHDNDTTLGWFEGGVGESSTREASEIDFERTFCMKYLNSDGREINWDFIRAALSSVADTAITPLQDILGLGNEARMNLPNSTSGNWSWRFEEGASTQDIAFRLLDLTRTYGR